MRQFRAGAVVFVAVCVAAIVLGIYLAIFPLRTDPEGPGIYMIISLGAVGAVGALFCLITGVRTMRGPRRR